MAPWGDAEHKGGGTRAAGAERDLGVQQGKGCRADCSSALAAGILLREGWVAWEPTQGKQEGEDKAWFSSREGKKKRRLLMDGEWEAWGEPAQRQKRLQGTPRDTLSASVPSDVRLLGFQESLTAATSDCPGHRRAGGCGQP